MFALLLDDHNYNERTNIYGLYKSLFRVNTNYPLQYDKTKSPANDKTKLITISIIIQIGPNQSHKNVQLTGYR